MDSGGGQHQMRSDIEPHRISDSGRPEARWAGLSAETFASLLVMIDPKPIRHKLVRVSVSPASGPPDWLSTGFGGVWHSPAKDLGLEQEGRQLVSLIPSRVVN